jgi:hypothetical protein
MASNTLTMKHATLFTWALIGASLPFLAGCVEREVVYRDRPAPAPTEVVEEAPAPPPPQTEVVTVAPGPPDVWLWAPGAWEWRGRWIWIGGHWVSRPHPGAVWVGAHWGWRGHHRIWLSGGWR